MPQIVPVPQYIEGCPVLAAVAVLARPGELPFEFVVICQQHDPPPGADPYVIWRAGTADGLKWTVRHGRPGLPWSEAIAVLASLASMPAL
jgi:hypothetical protein